MLLLERDRSGPLVLIPQLASTALEALAVALFESAPPGRRRLLPGPHPEASAPVTREWHRDAWVALPSGERDAVIVAAGPGAASLAPLTEEARVVATVRDPLEAASVLVRHGASLPNRRAFLVLHEDRGRLPKLQMRLFSNPQARALLLASREADELPVTLGPPSDADRWRSRLFDDAMSRVQPVASEGLGTAAADLAAQLGYPAEAGTRAAEIAERLGLRHGRPLIGPDLAELMRELNWLDGELFARCTAMAE